MIRATSFNAIKEAIEHDQRLTRRQGQALLDYAVKVAPAGAGQSYQGQGEERGATGLATVDYTHLFARALCMLYIMRRCESAFVKTVGGDFITKHRLVKIASVKMPTTCANDEACSASPMTDGTGG